MLMATIPSTSPVSELEAVGVAGVDDRLTAAGSWMAKDTSLSNDGSDYAAM